MEFQKNLGVYVCLSKDMILDSDNRKQQSNPVFAGQDIYLSILCKPPEKNKKFSHRFYAEFSDERGIFLFIKIHTGICRDTARRALTETKELWKRFPHRKKESEPNEQRDWGASEVGVPTYEAPYPT